MTINSGNSAIPGYFVVSTAPIDVDDDKGAAPEELMEIYELKDNGDNSPVKVELDQIVDNLLASKNPELIISIHGYNNSYNVTQERYQTIHEWINNPQNISQPDGKVYLGYRWPSEDLAQVKWKKAFHALPTLPSWIFFTGLAASLVLWFLVSIIPFGFLIALLLLSVASTTIILTFILMRLLVYYRDAYRATNFGVPDLIELIRKLDEAVFVKAKIPEENWKTKSAIQESREPNDRLRIKLTFIGHSLGSFVVTNTIRILSDVFDRKSIGNVEFLTSSDTQKLPDEEIGRVFSLGRLVLVAPDIPVETVIPRRSNFLRSSLRRFEEAYIFSNEADIVLRIASTIANYFSFPASTRINGYRLGNLTVKHFSKAQDTSGSDPKPGIVNLQKQDTAEQRDTRGGNYTFEDPYNHLEIRSSNIDHASLEEISSLDRIAAQKPVANLITYFDCTDYVDQKGGPGLLSDAKKRRALLLKDYILLTFSILFTRKDVHGGYFNGEFSQRVIYQLAFLGFKGFLNTFPLLEQTQAQHEQVPDEIQEKVLLEKKLWEFHQKCSEKQIQVVIAPERYDFDILQHKRDRSGY